MRALKSASVFAFDFLGMVSGPLLFRDAMSQASAMPLAAVSAEIEGAVFGALCRGAS